MEGEEDMKEEVDTEAEEEVEEHLAEEEDQSFVITVDNRSLRPRLSDDYMCLL